MKTAMLLAGALVLGRGYPGWTAQAGDPDAVVEDMLALIKKVTGVLASIENQKDVKAATPKLKRFGLERKALGVRYRKLKLSRKEEDRLKKKYGEEVKSRRRKLDREINRVSKIPGGPEALKLLDPRGKDKNR